MQKNNYTIAVVGLGTMGEGITQTIASAGFQILIFDISEKNIKKSKKNISYRLKRLVEKNKISSLEKDKILKRIRPVKNISDLSKSKLIIESIIEDLTSKQNVFCKLESIISKEVILATNTSSIDLNKISKPLKHPERFLGIHFFNPAPVMRLVEIVSSRKTDPNVVELVSSLSKKWGKIPVSLRSSPGFIVNRTARPFYCESLFVLKEQVVDYMTYDSIMKDCGGFKMGPFELMDLIGLDINFEVTFQMWKNFECHPRFLPSEFQKNLVEKGFLGKKSGKGFYSYGVNSAKIYIKNEKKTKKPSSIIIEGPENLPESLMKLINNGHLKKRIVSGEGFIRLPSKALIGLTNGKTSKERSKNFGQNFISLDICLDFEKTKRITLAPSLDCPEKILKEAVGLFQFFGKKVSIIQDIAGMIVARTIAMLVNEGSMLIHEKIADAEGIDLAMCYGLNHPLGPMEWGEKWGFSSVAQFLDNLCKVYGNRYEKSCWLRQKIKKI